MIELLPNGDFVYDNGVYNFDKILYNLNNQIEDGIGNIIKDNNTFGTIINKPLILSPVTNLVGYSGLVTTSPMSIFTTTYEGIHTSTDWEIATDITFTTIVDSSYDDVINMLTYPVFEGTPNTVYYIRVRHTSGRYTSRWSDIISYATGAVGITRPAISMSQVATGTLATLTPVIITGAVETHVSTDWIVATDIGFSNIVYSSINDTINLTTLTLSTGLNYNSGYYIKARQRTTNHITAYEVVSFRTAGRVATPILSLAATVVEGSVIVGTILNYDPANTYTVTTTVGSVVMDATNTFTYTPGLVNADTVAQISVVGNNVLIPSSSPAVANITVTDIPNVTDGLILNSNYETNGLAANGYKLP